MDNEPRVGFAVLGRDEMVEVKAANGNEFKLPSDVVEILDIVAGVNSGQGGPMLAFATYFSAAIIASSPDPDVILGKFIQILQVATKSMVAGDGSIDTQQFQAGPEGEQ